MAKLTVGGVPVPLPHEGVRIDETEVGQVIPSFDGTPRSSVRDRKLIWDVPETAWMTESAASTLITALEGTPPLTVAGDWPGSVSAVLAGPVKRRYNFLPGNTRVKLAFTLLES